jgi:hypothetical protein
MKLFNIVLVGLAASAAAQTSNDQAFLGIFAETHVTRIVGMKMKAMPNLPPGFKLPASVAAMMPGPPKRSLTVRLWSPSIAPDSATATLAPPPGLMVGDKLNLSLYRPQPAAATGGGTSGSGGSSSSQPPDMTIKIYWGSSPTVQPGQPKEFNLGTLTPEQQMAMGKSMQKGMSAMHMGKEQGNYFYKTGWTTGYWPGDSDTVAIPDGASLAGTFNLETNYTGNVSIDAPAGVDFLPGIEMTSPDLGQKIDFSGPINFQWNALPNAIGQFATIVGIQDKHTIIIWSSSEVYVDQLMADMGYMQMSEVKDSVSKKIFLPGDATSMTVPAGIFADADGSFMTMVAYGPGNAKDTAQPIPRIQTKSTLMLLLGGKKGGPRPSGDGKR